MTEKIKDKLREASVPIRTLLGLSFMAVLIAVVAAYAVDTDLDSMDDAYETIFSVNYTSETGDPALNYTNTADAALNYDSDSLVNSNEFLANTDPFVEDTDRDGFNDDVDDNPISRAYIDWGEEFWLLSLTNNTYDISYTQPPWLVDAYKVDGAWATNPTSFYVDSTNAADVGSLVIELDRTTQTNDVVLSLHLYDDSSATLYVDLCDTNGTPVATNLFGNILDGTDQDATIKLDVPLETYSAAAMIVVTRGTGDITIYNSSVYVDKDGDGLDDDQEAQLGTSDDSDDSDSDGLTDYAEVFSHYTEPSLLDTDDDGFSDGDEIAENTDPNDTDDYPFCNYLYKMKVDFSGYSKSETLTDFPALVVLNEELSGFLYNQFASANGYDLRFSASDGMTELNYEVEAWDSNGDSYVWVQVPTLTSNAYVYVYWGNTNATSRQAYCTNGATWNSGYEAVWHLNDTNSAGQMPDSTDNSANCDKYGSADTDGIISGAEDISGDYLKASISSSWDAFTYSCWANADTVTPSVPQTILARQDGTGTGRSILYQESGGLRSYIGGSMSQSGYAISAGDWTYYTLSYDSGSYSIYVNGQLQAGPFNKTEENATGDIIIGAKRQLSNSWDGPIDEVRVSSSSRSADWIWASWFNTVSNDVFCSYNTVASSIPSIDVGIANNVAGVSATPTATLMSDGDAATTVTVYYGTNDAGMTTSGWDSSASLGACSEGALSVNLIGLAEKTTYHYRFYAANAFADDWTTSAGSFTTTKDMSAWTKKMSVDYAGYDYQRTEDLVDFPVLVVLNTSISNFSYGDFASADGYDLRFTEQSGMDELSYEIESWDTNGSSYVWVKLPELSGAGTRVYVYWGNTNATTQQAYCTNGATWNSGYQAVVHLDEANAAGKLPDSSGNDAFCDNYGTVNAGGLIADAQELSGSTFLRCAGITDTWDTFTVSCWAKGDTFAGDNRTLVSRRDGTGTGRTWASVDASGENTSWIGGSESTGTFLAQTNEWNYYTVIYDSGSYSLYVNGETEGGPFNKAEEDATGGFIIGRHKNSGQFWDGLIDELRIENVSRSADWVWASWFNTASNDTFGLYGEVATISTGMGDDMDSLPDSWEESYFGNTYQSDEGDYDRDGLSNLEEYQNGTDPTEADTDDDGLSDSEEVDVHSTDPVDSDSDDDGFYDGYEVRNGGNPTDSNDIPAFTESGTVITDEQWTTVNLSNSFDDPIVVAATPSYNGDHSCLVRIKDVTASSFAIAVQEWDFQDGDHADESVSYIVVERGLFQLPSGITIQADSVDITSTGQTTSVSFDQALTDPAIFSAVVTTNDPAAICTRHDNVTSNGFDLLIQEEEASDQVHGQETITWIVWETSSGVLPGDLEYQVLSAPDGVDEAWRTVDIAPAATPSHIVASMQTIVGTDTAVVRYRNLGSSTVDLMLREEKSSDSEIGHGFEQVAMLIVSPLDSDDDLLSDEWETSNGTDKNDTDSDDDGLSDYDEITLYLTDPADEDTDSDGTNDMVVVSDLAGTNTWRRTGTWVETNGTLYATDPLNRRVEYKVDVSQGDLYRLGLDLSNMDTSVTETVDFRLQLLIDEVRIEWLDIDVSPATNYIHYIHTPWLSAGSHVIRLSWRDANGTDKDLGINRVLLQQIDAYDDDSNGRQDWVDDILGQNADTDSDGLSDLNELDVFNTDVLSVDTDSDTLTDYNELNVFGTDPLIVDSDTNGVSDAVLLAAKYGVDTDDREILHFQGTLHEDGTTLYNDSVKWRGELFKVYYDFTVTNSGMHRIGLKLSDFANNYDPPEDYNFKVDLTVNGYNVGRYVVFADIDLSGYGYINTPWLTEGTHRIGLEWVNALDLSGSIDPNIAIEEVQLYSVDGVDANTNGVQDWMEAELLDAGDTDGDGLNDDIEVSIYNTCPVTSDTDGDGLSDGNEVNVYATDPTDADSDDDGINDGLEVDHAFTDPLVAEFDGTVTNVSSILGADGTTLMGAWYPLDNEFFAATVRGSVKYSLSSTGLDVYRIAVEGSQHRSDYLGEDEFELHVYCDGEYLGRNYIVSEYGVCDTAYFFTPVIPAGLHEIKVVWENGDYFTSLQIKSVTLQSLGGYDVNSNGVKDWVEQRVAAQSTVDQMPQQTSVSPLCTEGDGLYVSMISVVADGASSEVEHGAGDRWYANADLSASTDTEVEISLQNGFATVTNVVSWTPMDILSGDDISLRVGDTLMMTSAPDGATNGTQDVDITIDGSSITNYTAGALDSVLHHFETAGDYVVSGSFDGGVTNGSINVTVVSGALPTNIACMYGVERSLDCIDLDMDGLTLEYPNELAVENSGELSGGGTELELTIQSGVKQHFVVRLNGGGSIVADATVDGVQGYSPDSMVVVEDYADGSKLLELRFVLSHVPPDLRVDMNVVVSGVTFDDGTITRSVYANEFEDTGEYKYRMYASPGVDTSSCHKIRVYQGDTKIGGDQ